MKTTFLTTIIFAALIIFYSFDSEKTQLTANEQNELITAHNKYRAELNITGLEWREDLATEAQKWANFLAKSGCELRHSNTQNGENIFWGGTENTAAEVVDDWASEKKFYNGEKINSSNYEKFGHYTQIVWEHTKYVGCGKALCKDGSEIWVCNYYPAGNYIGEFPYKKK